MDTSVELSKNYADNRNNEGEKKMPNDNIDEEDSPLDFEKNRGVKNSTTERKYDEDEEEKHPTHCYGFWSFLVGVGIIAGIICLILDATSESEKSRSKNKLARYGSLPNELERGHYYGSRERGYGGMIGGYYFSNGLGAIYNGHRDGGTRLGGGGRGRGGGFSGRGGFGGCFGEYSFVWTKNVNQSDSYAEKIYVKDLREGSLVGTVDLSIVQNGGNTFRWTRATDVTVSKGTYRAHTFIFSNSIHLTVTSPHLMILRIDGVSFFLRADMVKIGDTMLVGNKEVNVTNIKNVKISTKVSVETEDGTISVNDVFVSGLCDYNPEATNRIVKCRAMIDQYIQKHFGKEYHYMCLNDLSWKKCFMINNGLMS